MTRYGSLTNQLLAGTNGQPEPLEGMGATLLSWTDRYPYTIVAITARFKSGPRKGLAKVIVARECRHEKDPLSAGGMGHQDWVIFPDIWAGPEREFTRRKDGSFRDAGDRQLRLASRDYYHDWSF